MTNPYRVAADATPRLVASATDCARHFRFRLVEPSDELHRGRVADQPESSQRASVDAEGRDVPVHRCKRNAIAEHGDDRGVVLSPFRRADECHRWTTGFGSDPPAP